MAISYGASILGPRIYAMDSGASFKLYKGQLTTETRPFGSLWGRIYYQKPAKHGLKQGGVTPGQPCTPIMVRFHGKQDIDLEERLYPALSGCSKMPRRSFVQRPLVFEWQPGDPREWRRGVDGVTVGQTELALLKSGDDDGDSCTACWNPVWI